MNVVLYHLEIYFQGQTFCYAFVIKKSAGSRCPRSVENVLAQQNIDLQSVLRQAKDRSC